MLLFYFVPLARATTSIKNKGYCNGKLNLCVHVHIWLALCVQHLDRMKWTIPIWVTFVLFIMWFKLFSLVKGEREREKVEIDFPFVFRRSHYIVCSHPYQFSCITNVLHCKTILKYHSQYTHWLMLSLGILWRKKKNKIPFVVSKYCISLVIILGITSMETIAKAKFACL